MSHFKYLIFVPRSINHVYFLMTLIAWYEEAFDVTLGTSDSIAPPQHSPDALVKFRMVLESLSPWQFTGMHPLFPLMCYGVAL